MMTWVQTQKLRRDEASLMTEWQTRWAQSACFNADGVVDYERWSALPDRKHIVVLLKETNGLHGSLVVGCTEASWSFFIMEAAKPTTGRGIMSHAGQI